MEKQLRAQLQAAQAELAALRPTSSFRWRLHPTARYAGANNLQEFISQMRLMIRHQEVLFNSDADCVDYISMHLVEGVLTWFTALVKLEHPAVTSTLETFWTALEE